MGTDWVKPETRPLGWGCLFVTCGCPNRLIKWDETLHGGGVRPWDRHRVGVSVKKLTKMLFSVRREPNLDMAHKTDVRWPQFRGYRSGQLLFTTLSDWVMGSNHYCIIFGILHPHCIKFHHYCIIFRNFQNNITASLEGCNKYVSFSQTLCTLLRFISNFVSSNYFLNFSQTKPGNSASK